MSRERSHIPLGDSPRAARGRGDAGARGAPPWRLSVLAVAVGVLVLAAACGGSGGSGSTGGAPSQLRLGVFANVTHASGLVGINQGLLAKELGSTKLSTAKFNAGPSAMEALLAGSIDATYVGPSPAVNAYVKSHGEALRLVAGATSGGAELVVKPSITAPDQLRGKKVATPELGNTQDVALRYWLAQIGLKTNTTGGGDVSIQPTDNASIVTAFRAGQLDGAWVPEPYASQLVLQGGGKVLVDEKSLWPQGTFVTTTLAVSKTFLDDHPDTVRALLRGQVATNAWIAAHPAEAKAAVNAQLAKLAGKPLPANVLDRAWGEIQVTNDPLAGSLKTGTDHAVQVGLLKQPNLKGIYDLRPLNDVLRSQNQPQVQDAGLAQ
jgi:NitT/TauT family transport system substrate-binding protein